MMKNNLIRRSVLTILLCLGVVSVFACPACEKQQPKLLIGITHGTGPEGSQDYIIIAIAVVIVLFTLFYSVKWLIKPGEQAKSHIKQIILNAD
jgi:uncharacterized protein HemY